MLKKDYAKTVVVCINCIERMLNQDLDVPWDEVHERALEMVCLTEKEYKAIEKERWGK